MFRKKPFVPCGSYAARSIIEKQEVLVQVQDKDGTVHTEVQVKEVDLCDPELPEKIFPPVAEYTYENLLKAGVPIKEVSTKILNVDGVDELTTIAENIQFDETSKNN